jgi:radical SAM superfamily enzyme YgiQ (UPF0313 family)
MLIVSFTHIKLIIYKNIKFNLKIIMQTNKNTTKMPLRSHEKIISQIMPSLIDEKHNEVSLVNNVSPSKDIIYFRSNQNCTRAFNETYSNPLKAKYYITLLSTLIQEQDIQNLSSDLKDKVKIEELNINIQTYTEISLKNI